MAGWNPFMRDVRGVGLCISREHRLRFPGSVGTASLALPALSAPPELMSVESLPMVSQALLFNDHLVIFQIDTPLIKRVGKVQIRPSPNVLKGEPGGHRAGE